MSAEVIDLRTLTPLDRDTLLESVVKTGRAVIVPEAPRTNGFGGELSALIMEHALLQLLAPVQRVAGFDTVFPLAQNEHLYLPSRERVIQPTMTTATASAMQLAAKRPARVVSACREKPSSSLKSVRPLLPPNPMSLRKKASSSA